MHRSSDPGFKSASGSAPRRRRARWVAAAALTLAPLLGVASACLDRPIGSPPPVTTNIFVDKIQQTSVDKIDLLFMIDNSVSMSDKQAILQLAVPDLVNRLVNPICVDSMGNQDDPPPPGGECPPGFSQEFNPINNINIGVVSSSLGDVGANVACPAENANVMGFVPDRIDLAHLMGSLSRGRGTANTPEGFLQWRVGGDLDDLNQRFQRMVAAVGENGCGWEASLESWYRFLVDPYPYRELVRVTCPGSDSPGLFCVQQATDADGTILLDQTLLDQRAAFLRPDSLVAVIMLSDENDCSMQVGAQTWVVANLSDERPMFRGSSTCATDANDKCCYSCPLGPPAGCDADPICNADPANMVLEDRLPASEDGQNLRCFQQKRRFGVDFLYPTERYVNALSQANICWNSLDLSLEGCSSTNIRPNPLYAGGRSQDLVFFGGIIGVPYQAIQSDVDARGNPLPAGALRFQNAEELDDNDTWSEILGDPGRAWRAASGGRAEVTGTPARPPTMPQMLESAFERTGIQPNPINGREYNTIVGGAASGPRDDLQYACIFPLPEPVNCAALGQGETCDCKTGNLNRPLCEETPGQTPPGTTQYWSKAYPGTRHLEVLQGYGANSIVASICARDVEDGDDADESDFGYRPAIASIVDRLKEQLGDRCLPRALLTNDTDGSVACTLVETIPNPEEPCRCNENFARRAPDPIVDSVVRGQLAAENNNPCGVDDESCSGACLCEVLQVQQVPSNPAGALEQCRTDPDASGVQGWCYVDDRDPASAALVENCPATQRRILRFVGQGLAPNSTTYVACQGSSFAARDE